MVAITSKSRVSFSCWLRQHRCYGLGLHYRFYDNGGCDHNSAPGTRTHPIVSPRTSSGTSGTCLSAPTGINWNRLEEGVNGVVGLITCDSSGMQADTYCYAPAPK
ncbi:hypothetical protein BJ912DRAFT_1002911 [Pholiota molesta]|nr:hypothetical protein BJ912DRAFT_1002911 [Pholiota molesta]